MTTVYTKTVGPIGRDYATIAAAEADVTNIVGSSDLVSQDAAVVFEIDAGTYTGGLQLFGSLTTDSTRNVTYRPAAGSEHGGRPGSGVIIQSGSSSAAVYLTDPFSVLEGVNIESSNLYTLWHAAEGGIARSCILSGTQRGAIIYQAGTASNPCTIENCVVWAGELHAFWVLDTRPTGQTHGRTINCTAMTSPNDAFKCSKTTSQVL